MAKLSKDKRDIFYRKAKEEGWRARSAFKLIQLDSVFHLFDGVTRAVDLCAAPGSWSQVLSRKIYQNAEMEIGEAKASEKVKLVSVDLNPMAPLPGVIQIQGDITSVKTANEIIKAMDGKAQLVVCDGAPDVTGLHDLDEYLQAQLVFAAFSIAYRLLEKDGTFVAKVFRGPDASDLLYSQMHTFFPFVTISKPKSSRNSSLEAFIVCKKFTPLPGYIPPLGSLGDDEDEKIKEAKSRMDELVADEKKDEEEEADRVIGEEGVDIPEVILDPAAAKIQSSLQAALTPFLACGDLSGFDSDASYALSHAHAPLPPVQPPIDTAYKEATEMRRRGELKE
ncbi:Putative tRNA (cytidine(32)/guanosine(34)-2'-O)-methyltransferase [Aduncisulcus paluster]|uniref:Putative tRNA (cytidine(32)/guanosine(34)-2'-O)-methyltransferase n=1 Tax=Aduncisulcus paluster TaxID=2918883 RepID=A0ABQ5K458_9EUKA|nr:Putative tRNA (cytidine(32)/guanosine(34)-2'-O)-methyltransferase [Aduncisulcus paluster]